MKKRKIHSIKRQFAFISIGLLAGTIFVCCLMNIVFLPGYYEKTREMVLVDIYDMCVHNIEQNEAITGDFFVNLQREAGKSNASGIVQDASMLYVFGDESAQLQKQLRDNIFGRNTGVIKIIKMEDTYVLQRTLDKETRIEYLEIYGVAGNGISIMLRVPLADVEESATIANRLLIYIGMLAILISSVIMWLVSRKVTDPILQLTDISEKMIRLDFEAKYSGNTKTEIALLGENINKLSESLERTISELKTANNELQKDLEKKNQVDEMRKEFLSNVSHELKTPIALIQGYAEGLQEDVNDDAESKSFYCDVIMDEASKMNTLVKKLMTLNQLEFGNDVVTLERFDIVALICNYVQSAQILTRQNGISVRMEQYDALYVWADEFKTEEVFMNYFTNAVNHAGGQDKIIDIRLTMKDKTVRISVFNTGQPIPEESMPHIWEKFYKVDKARTREYGGSGVGLSIVKAIMESMNQQFGVINYENGVEFWFELEAVNEQSR